MLGLLNAAAASTGAVRCPAPEQFVWGSESKTSRRRGDVDRASGAASFKAKPFDRRVDESVTRATILRLKNTDPKGAVEGVGLQAHIEGKSVGDGGFQVYFTRLRFRSRRRGCGRLLLLLSIVLALLSLVQYLTQ